MPPVIIAAAAIAVSYGAAAAAVAAGIVAAGSLGAALIAGAAGLLVSTLGGMVIGKPRAPGAPSLGGQTFTQKSPTAARRIIYGRDRVGGVLLFQTSISASADSNERLLMVVAWAGHECDAIEMMWGNNNPIPIVDNIDPDHPGTQMPQLGDTLLPGVSPYGALNGEGAMYFSSHLGAPGQVADQDLINWGVGWTSDQILNAVCYTFFHLFFFAQFYPSGVPNLTALIRGRKCYDPRTGTTAWTQNPALCIRDYLTARDENGNPIGLGALESEIDEDSFIAAANICDEQVTLADGTVATFTDSTTATISPGTPFVLPVGATVTWSGGTATMTFATGVAVVNGRIASTLAATTAVTFGTGGTGTLPFGTQVTVSPDTVIHFSDGVAATINSSAGTTEAAFTMNGSFTVDNTPGQIIEDLLTSCGGKLIYEAGLYRLKLPVYEAPVDGIVIDESWLRGSMTVQDGPSRQVMFNTVRGTYIDPTSFYQPKDFLPVENPTFRANDGGYEIPTDFPLPYTQSPTMANRLAKLTLNRSRLLTMTMQCNFLATKCRVMENYKVNIAALGWAEKEFRVTSWSFVQGGGIDLEFEEEDADTYETGPGQMLIPKPETNLANPLFIAPPTDVTCVASTLVQADGTSVPQITISWVASLGPFVDEYVVQWKAVGASTWNELPPTKATSVVVSPVADGVAYVAQVKAINLVGVPSSFVMSADSGTASVDLSTPPVPTDFTVTPGARLNVLAWQLPAVSTFNPTLIRATEIWYAEGSHITQTPTEASATKLTDATGSSYPNTNLAQGEARTYWIRFVTIANVEGGFTTGVYSVTPAVFPASDLGDEAITSSMLVPALQQPIASIDPALQAIFAGVKQTQIFTTAQNAAMAQSLTTVQSTVNGFTSAVAENSTAVDGIKAQWTLQVSLDSASSPVPYIAGMGVVADLVDGVPSSEITFLTSVFTVAQLLTDGTVAKVSPFTINSSGLVVIQDALIDTINVNKLGAGTITTPRIVIQPDSEDGGLIVYTVGGDVFIDEEHGIVPGAASKIYYSTSSATGSFAPTGGTPPYTPGAFATLDVPALDGHYRTITATAIFDTLFSISTISTGGESPETITSNLFGYVVISLSIDGTVVDTKVLTGGGGGDFIYFLPVSDTDSHTIDLNLVAASDGASNGTTIHYTGAKITLEDSK